MHIFVLIIGLLFIGNSVIGDSVNMMQVFIRGSIAYGGDNTLMLVVYWEIHREFIFYLFGNICTYT